MLNVTVGRGKNCYREAGVPEGLFEAVIPKDNKEPALGRGRVESFRQREQCVQRP